MYVKKKNNTKMIYKLNLVIIIDSVGTSPAAPTARTEAPRHPQHPPHPPPSVSPPLSLRSPPLL